LAASSSSTRRSRRAGAAIAEIFTEVIIAPRFSDEALAILGEKKNLRLMVAKGGMGADALQEIRSVVGGVLVQDRDRTLGRREDFKVVTKRSPRRRNGPRCCLAGRSAST
jgi:AICAR transformylase/IMP cyclohydrolase PurH